MGKKYTVQNLCTKSAIIKFLGQYTIPKEQAFCRILKYKAEKFIRQSIIHQECRRILGFKSKEMKFIIRSFILKVFSQQRHSICIHFKKYEYKNGRQASLAAHFYSFQNIFFLYIANKINPFMKTKYAGNKKFAGVQIIIAKKLVRALKTPVEYGA